MLGRFRQTIQIAARYLERDLVGWSNNEKRRIERSCYLLHFFVNLGRWESGKIFSLDDTPFCILYTTSGLPQLFYISPSQILL